MRGARYLLEHSADLAVGVAMRKASTPIRSSDGCGRDAPQGEALGALFQPVACGMWEAKKCQN